MYEKRDEIHVRKNVRQEKNWKANVMKLAKNKVFILFNVFNCC